MIFYEKPTLFDLTTFGLQVLSGGLQVLSGGLQVLLCGSIGWILVKKNIFIIIQWYFRKYNVDNFVDNFHKKYLEVIPFPSYLCISNQKNLFMKKKISFDKKALQFFIGVLRNPKSVGPDKYDYYYRKFKNGYEICLAVQMVMFGRTLETSIDMIKQEIGYTSALRNYGTMAIENNLTIA